jgi:hypothetical protein
MRRIFESRISTLIAAMLPGYVRSLPSVISRVCPRCGLSITARKEVGTFGFVFEIDLLPPNLSHFRHAVAVTHDGKLSISCESLISGEAESPIPFGGGSGISFSPANLNEAQPCGCDPGLAKSSPHRPNIVKFYACENYPDCAYGKAIGENH